MARMDATIRKAIFPAAGLGTRFLPATKAQPKEMLVLVDKPVIQYGVEEAVDSGLDNILIVTGRYILTPDIFPALEATVSDRTGEIQLTNGLRHLLLNRPLYACEIDGVRHDTGNKLGFLKALVYFALHRPELAEPFRKYLESLATLSTSSR